jgi:hypothetical protein
LIATAVLFQAAQDQRALTLHASALARSSVTQPSFRKKGDYQSNPHGHTARNSKALPPQSVRGLPQMLFIAFETAPFLVSMKPNQKE